MSVHVDIVYGSCVDFLYKDSVILALLGLYNPILPTTIDSFQFEYDENKIKIILTENDIQNCLNSDNPDEYFEQKIFPKLYDESKKIKEKIELIKSYIIDDIKIPEKYYISSGGADYNMDLFSELLEILNDKFIRKICFDEYYFLKFLYIDGNCEDAYIISKVFTTDYFNGGILSKKIDVSITKEEKIKSKIFTHLILTYFGLCDKIIPLDKYLLFQGF